MLRTRQSSTRGALFVWVGLLTLGSGSALAIPVDSTSSLTNTTTDISKQSDLLPGGGSHPPSGGGGGGGSHPPNGGGGSHPPNGGGGSHPPNGGGGGHPPNGGGGGHPPNGGGGGHPPNGGGGGHPPNGGGGGHPPNGGGGGHPPNGGGGGHPPNGGGGGHPPNGGGGGHPPNGGGGGHPHEPPVVHNGNRVPPSHVDHINNSDRRVGDVMRHDPRVSSYVGHGGDVYRNNYRIHVEERSRSYDSCHDRYSPFYRQCWYEHHFYGFYWPFRVILDLDAYLWHPYVCWFYCDTWDDYYYRQWYGDAYDRYPELRTPFYRGGVFYPTDSLNDLLVGMGSADIDQQIGFRRAMTDTVRKVESQLSMDFNATVVLGRNDIVVSKYQLLDNSVVLEGFVNYGNNQFAFKALLDFSDIRNDVLFMPTQTTGQPSQASVIEIDRLNDRIVDLGGVIEQP